MLESKKQDRMEGKGVTHVEAISAKEERYKCGECEDNIFCEMCACTYSSDFKKPSEDRDGKYIWVCPGERTSQK